MAIYLDELTARSSTSRTAVKLTRGEFFAGLFALGCLSGVTSRIVQSGQQLGWTEAFFSSFEISIIIWISCACGIALVLRDRTTGLRSTEYVLGAFFALLVILPIGPLSWFAVTVLSLYLLVSETSDSSRRGAIILLATTVPMLWSRLLFQFFANPILQIDASLVALILGTHRSGDLVQFADGSGVLVILPTCSSLANVSLAFVCWATISELVRHRRTAYDLLWCLMACCSVIVVNVTRISFMGLSQHHYAAFHSPWGDAISNTFIFILIVGFSVLGVRREVFPRI